MPGCQGRNPAAAQLLPVVVAQNAEDAQLADQSGDGHAEVFHERCRRPFTYLARRFAKPGQHGPDTGLRHQKMTGEGVDPRFLVVSANMSPADSPMIGSGSFSR